MNKMFYNCSSLKALNLSSFNISDFNDLNNLFNGGLSTGNINLTISNSNGEIKDIFLSTYPNLMICRENIDDISLNSLKKINIYCNYNTNYNNTQTNYVCYMEDLYLYNNTNNICSICKKKNFKPDNYLININNSYLNCIELNIENRTEIIQHIIDNLINEFNITELNSGKDKKIIDKNKVIILTSTESQKNNEDKNNITMNLGKCENLLKKNYNISNNNSLYILQIISEEEGMKIPKIEYEVYYPLTANNLTKLNLNLCKDTKIEISISVKINDSLDKYNPKSGYYNNICSIATSESGTDISLKDRKNEFIDNNMSLCEENCDLIEYNKTKQKAKCSCDIKLGIPENYDIKFNKDDFLKSFIDIKNMLNLNIIKCYKTVFKIKNLKKNIGFFIVDFITIIYFITLFIFSTYSYDKIKKEVFNIIFALKIKANPNKKTKKKKHHQKSFKEYRDKNKTIKFNVSNRIREK